MNYVKSFMHIVRFMASPVSWASPVSSSVCVFET